MRQDLFVIGFSVLLLLPTASIAETIASTIELHSEFSKVLGFLHGVHEYVNNPYFSNSDQESHLLFCSPRRMPPHDFAPNVETESKDILVVQPDAWLKKEQPNRFETKIEKLTTGGVRVKARLTELVQAFSKKGPALEIQVNIKPADSNLLKAHKAKPGISTPKEYFQQDHLWEPSWRWNGERAKSYLAESILLVNCDEPSVVQKLVMIDSNCNYDKASPQIEDKNCMDVSEIGTHCCIA